MIYFTRITLNNEIKFAAFVVFILMSIHNVNVMSHDDDLFYVVIDLQCLVFAVVDGSYDPQCVVPCVCSC